MNHAIEACTFATVASSKTWLRVQRRILLLDRAARPFLFWFREDLAPGSADELLRRLSVVEAPEHAAVVVDDIEEAILSFVHMLPDPEALPNQRELIGLRLEDVL